MVGRLFRSSTFYLVVGILALGAVATRWLSDHDPAEFQATLGAAAIPVTLTLHVVLAVSPFPSDLIAIASGAIYGFGLGFCLSWTGWFIASVLEFGLGRRARQDFELEQGLQRAPKWLRRFPVDHPVFLVGVRQVPWLGMHVGSFLPGASGVGIGRFLWCTAIGIIPGSVLMTAIGAGLIDGRN
ncbi:SNARE associated Golgi protein [Neorhodopirellula pilleata]|uniref:TVP38/TMEM64 family membrane protein n=2 Tax=Neorhodopirellula pilleata TaxID=2714738 RepID=A0A5C6ABX8_9BACT|nr:SNARE associated Golgi protein [Neorhodopirellula pilleata]